MKVAPFFFGRLSFKRGSCLYWGDDFKMGTGGAANWVCDLYEDIFDGSNPRMISCVLTSVDELSDETMLPDGLDALLAMSEAEESRGCPVGARLAEDWATFTFDSDDGFGSVGVESDAGSLYTTGAGSDSEGSGSRFFFSWMDMTIFSRSIGVMCFS